MRHTARALIIRDKKLLLVTGHDADFWWTPGGGLEENETSLEALHREVLEELSARISSVRPYASYTFEDQAVDCFIVEVIDEIKLANEITKSMWFSKHDSIRLSRGVEFQLLPMLIRDDLL